MKTLLKYFMLFLLAVFAISCSEDNTIEDTESAGLNTIYKQEIEPKKDYDIPIEKAYEPTKDLQGLVYKNFNEGANKHLNLSDFKNIFLAKMKSPYKTSPYYVFFEAKNTEGQLVNVAVRYLNSTIDKENKEVAKTTTGETHTCTGDNCSSCGFTYDPYDCSMSGCECNVSVFNNYCNHTVSSGGDNPCGGE